LTTDRTRNVQQEKLEKQKKITVAKLLVGEKRISSAPKLSKRGGSWIWISTCWPDAPETKDSNNFRCTSERERERERENQNDERIGGKARSKRGGGGGVRTRHETNALQNPCPLQHNIYARHLYVLPKASIIYTVLYDIQYILLSFNLFEEGKILKIWWILFKNRELAMEYFLF
jgi:hypothetical protein